MKTTQKIIKERLSKKLFLPIWVLLIFIGITIVSVGFMLSSAIKSERELAVNEYKQQSFAETNSLSDVVDYSLFLLLFFFTLAFIDTINNRGAV